MLLPPRLSDVRIVLVATAVAMPMSTSVPRAPNSRLRCVNFCGHLELIVEQRRIQDRNLGWKNVAESQALNDAVAARGHMVGETKIEVSRLTKHEVLQAALTILGLQP